MEGKPVTILEPEKRSGALRSHFEIVFDRRSIVQVRVTTLLGLYRPRSLSFILADLLSYNLITNLNGKCIDALGTLTALSLAQIHLII
ncbi:hypothetical protein BHE74_00059402 [Ensete ventricosum]|nr:hypothetical protein GW17_00035478 [Ensete ventricosum]RWW35644.1 hypothetical protein BHE74_00059402 [Ensete ventricosum]RZR78697.1 hypothetical protein BHM03_00004119 [Ensete ventricosum]